MNRSLSKGSFLATAILIIPLSLASIATAASLTIASSAIRDSGRIPSAFTCSGSDKSPPLAWSGIPEGTKSLALIVRDPDAPGGIFIHWVAFNIPANSSGLEEAIPNRPEIPSGGIQGTNSFGRIGYGGPCPPRGPAHHYHFRLFALDEALQLGSDATAGRLEEAMKGHVKASAEFVGIFGR
jgi:Raf kinase inhibitor-like YbhB/YbcL family protein